MGMATSSSAFSIMDDKYFMDNADLASKQSKDNESKVGACIVNDDKVIVGIGYNRMPRNCNELPWKKNDRNLLNTKKYYDCLGFLLMVESKTNTTPHNTLTIKKKHVTYSKEMEYTINCKDC